MTVRQQSSGIEPQATYVYLMSWEGDREYWTYSLANFPGNKLKPTRDDSWLDSPPEEGIRMKQQTKKYRRKMEESCKREGEDEEREQGSKGRTPERLDTLMLQRAERS